MKLLLHSRLLALILSGVLSISTSFAAYTTGQFLTGNLPAHNNYSHVVVGPSNVFYGAWRGVNEFKFATFNGTTWTELTSASFTGAQVATAVSDTELDGISDWGQEAMRMEANGNIHIVFHAGAAAASSATRRGLIYGKYTAATTSWAFRKLFILTGASGGRDIVSRSECLALDASGHPHVVFSWSDSAVSDEFLEYAFFNGTSWNANGVTNSEDAQQLDAATFDGMDINGPSIAFDSAGNLHCAYRKDSDTGSPDIWYLKRTGTTWSTPVNVADVNNATNTSILVDSADKVHIAEGFPSSNVANFRVTTNVSGSFVTSTVATTTLAGAATVAFNGVIMKINNAGRRIIGSTLKGNTNISNEARLIYETSPGVWAQEQMTTGVGTMTFNFPSMALRNSDNTVMMIYHRNVPTPAERNAQFVTGIPASFSATAPTVTTAAQSVVTATSATLGGNVTADGGASVTERGIVWKTSTGPTTADTKVANGSGTGIFSATVNSLPAGTTVFVRAYAINSVNTSYGNEISFTTLSNNADLSALALTTATINEAFAAATTSYTASVPNATSTVTVTPTRAQANATIEARVGANAFASVTSGSPSASLALAVGANTIQVRVTAQDGTTPKTYSIVVTRAAPPADIPMTLSGGTLTIDASGSAGAANVTLRYVTGAGGPFLEITDTSRTLGVPAGGSAVNSNTVRVPLSSFTSLVLNGSPLADTFSFDVGGGDFFPSGGITVNGGAPSTPPGDVIDVVGTLAFLDYDATNVGAGTVDLGIGTLVFTGIEPLDFSGATITGTVTIDVDPGNTFAGNVITTIAAVDAGVNTEVTFGTSGLESIKLGAVTGAVVINGDNVEQDYFVLSGLGSAMAGDFTIDGKGGDGDVIEVPTTSTVTVAGVDKTTTLRADFIGVGRDTTTITTRGILNVKGPLTLEATGAFDNASATPIWGPVGGIWGASVPTQFQFNSSGGFTLSQRGCIVIRGELNKTGGADATIAVRATAGISMAGTGGGLNAANTGGSIVSTSNKAHIVLNADRDADSVGMVQIGGSGALTSNGGNITIGGGINPLTTPTRGFLAGTFYASGFLMTTASINSGGGDISIRGQGPATTAFNAQGHGLNIAGVGNTMASGAGSLTLVGTATTGTSGAGHGIFIQGVGTGSNILSSTTGAISLSGTGTALSASHGLQFTSTSTASSSITTAAGTVTLNGTAMSGGINHGINFTSNVNVSATSTGTVAATGSTAGTGLGINLAPATGTSGYTTAGGALTLTADTMNLNGGVGTESISTGSSGSVTLKPLTAATLVNLGSAVDTTASTLELSTAELDNVTAGTLAIGDAASGAINVSAIIAPLNFKTLALSNNTTFSATGGFTSDATSASVFEKVTVTGTINIQAGASLSLASAGGYIWNGTDTFKVLDNDAADPITGTFNLPSLTNFLGSTITAQESYTGGTGNDLVFSKPTATIVSLTRQSANPNKNASSHVADRLQ